MCMMCLKYRIILLIYEEPVEIFTHQCFAPGRRPVPRSKKAGLHFDIATALHVPFRHISINVATAVAVAISTRKLHRKIASKNSICGEMRDYL